MPLTFIRKEKTLRELATRVFDVSPTEPEALKRAEAALEAANPGVDFRRLEPGTVLVVPERADVRPAARETAAGPIVADVGSKLDRALAEGRKRFGAGFGTMQQEREAAAKLLKSAAVKRLTTADPELKADVDRVTEALAAESKAARDRAAQTDDVLKQAQQEIEALLARLT